jgi:hypothetical protein
MGITNIIITRDYCDHISHVHYDIIIARDYCDHISHQHDDIIFIRDYYEYIVLMIFVDSK